VGGAGRDLRQVGVRGGESVWGATPRTRTDVEGGKLESAELAQCENTCAAGVGGADGRAVVMGCGEPLARGGGVVEEGWRGLVWCRSGLPVGISGMRRFAVGGLAGWGGCHTLVTSGAKHGGTEGDTLRRFLQVGGRGGTGWDG
jgi:hypothetical protein